MSQAEFPFVSILVAARNEAERLPRCLAALNRLSYPAHRYEVLVGNDASEDGTWSILQAWQGPNRRAFSISETWGTARGKSNVLAQLARQAQGEYLFICDADIAVPPGWIPSLLRHFRPEVGVVSGITAQESTTGFGHWQSVEWLGALGLITTLDRLRIPTTAIGNNMALRRSAYEATGGYENLPYSLTEDRQIYQVILDQGWRVHQDFSPRSLAWSLPAPNWRVWLNQHRRWLTGAAQLPLWIQFLFYTQVWAYPLFALLAVFYPVWGLSLIAAKYLLQTLWHGAWVAQAGLLGRLWPWVLLHEGYWQWGYARLLLTRHHTFDWKGRAFSGKDR